MSPPSLCPCHLFLRMPEFLRDRDCVQSLSEVLVPVRGSGRQWRQAPFLSGAEGQIAAEVHGQERTACSLSFLSMSETEHSPFSLDSFHYKCRFYTGGRPCQDSAEMIKFSSGINHNSGTTLSHPLQQKLMCPESKRTRVGAGTTVPIFQDRREADMK